jgi:hypothetical protein
LLRGRRGDRIVAEVNNGGEMVESTIRMVDENVPYTAVHASRGKVIRAEPVSALYEQGRVHHVGTFAKLEDQMASFTHEYDRAKGESPDRMDACVWALTELMVDQPDGMGVFEYYRQLAEATAGKVPAPAFGFEMPGPNTVEGSPFFKVAAKPKPETVRARAPAGISQVYGGTGKTYTVGPDRIVEMSRDDYMALRAGGFVEV